MPDYNGVLMRGPLITMTIGNYVENQLCKLDSLSYTIPNDSPWEIALNDDKTLVLPHIIEIQLSFTPIGSQTNGSNEISERSTETSHIAQTKNKTQYIGNKIFKNLNDVEKIANDQKVVWEADELKRAKDEATKKAADEAKAHEERIAKLTAEDSAQSAGGKDAAYYQAVKEARENEEAADKADALERAIAENENNLANESNNVFLPDE
jgi:hypothetical protein